MQREMQQDRGVSEDVEPNEEGRLKPTQGDDQQTEVPVAVSLNTLFFGSEYEAFLLKQLRFV